MNSLSWMCFISGCVASVVTGNLVYLGIGFAGAFVLGIIEGVMS